MHQQPLLAYAVAAVPSSRHCTPSPPRREASVTPPTPTASAIAAVRRFVKTPRKILAPRVAICEDSPLGQPRPPTLPPTRRLSLAERGLIRGRFPLEPPRPACYFDRKRPNALATRYSP